MAAESTIYDTRYDKRGLSVPVGKIGLYGHADVSLDAGITLDGELVPFMASPDIGTRDADYLANVAMVPAPVDDNGDAQLSVGTTVAQFKTPDEWRGKYVEFTLVGGTGTFTFGSSSSVTVTYDDTATVDSTTKVITLSNSHGGYLANGVGKQRSIPFGADYDYFAVDCDTASIILYCEVVQKPGH